MNNSKMTATKDCQKARKWVKVNTGKEKRIARRNERHYLNMLDHKLTRNPEEYEDMVYMCTKRMYTGWDIW